MLHLHDGDDTACVHTECVRLLVQAGADVHARDDEALRKAVEGFHSIDGLGTFGIRTIKLLLQAGANVHAKDDEALRTATTRGLKLLEFN